MGYPKQVYQRATAQLSAKRQAAEALTAARQQEIAEKIPEIAQITAQLAQTAAAVTRAIAANPHTAQEMIPDLQEKNLALQQRRLRLLTQAGYPADYLEPQKACAVCGGSGYIGPKMCVCLHNLLRQEAFSQLSAVSQVKNSTFEDFSLDFYPQQPAAEGIAPRAQMSEVFAACKRYAHDFTHDSPSLLMLGKTGLGKTHLSLSIAKVVTDAGYGVLYTPVQKLMDKLEAGKFSFEAQAKEQYAQDIESVLACDLLVLDDLGAEFITQFSSSVLYNIVNTRLVENKPMIISTNLEPAEIEAKYSQRMFSRLIGGCRAFKFSGKDIRFIKKIKP